MDDLVIEFDKNRGVLWVHSPKGFTVLRICGLPPNLWNLVQHANNVMEMVDVTVTEWKSEIS